MRERALVAAALISMALPSAATAFNSAVYTKLPPSGRYKFYGVGLTGSGSLTVHGRTVSKITFTLPTGSAYHSSNCTIPVGTTEQSSILVTVSGRFQLLRQEPSVAHGYRYWVVGSIKQPHPANDVGVAPLRATFSVPGMAPLSGRFGLFFQNNGAGVETGNLYAELGGCLSFGGDFDLGYHG